MTDTDYRKEGEDDRSKLDGSGWTITLALVCGNHVTKSCLHPFTLHEENSLTPKGRKRSKPSLHDTTCRNLCSENRDTSQKLVSRFTPLDLNSRKQN